MGKLFTKEALELYYAQDDYGLYLKKTNSDPFIVTDRNFMKYRAKAFCNVSTTTDMKWVFKVMIITQYGYLPELAKERGFTVDQNKLEEFCVYQEIYYVKNSSLKREYTGDEMYKMVEDWMSSGLKYFRYLQMPLFYFENIDADKFPMSLDVVTGHAIALDTGNILSLH